MKLKIITNPVTEIFSDLIRSSHEQLLVSPFIKTNAATMILENKSSDAEISILTNYKLNSFYRRSSDLNAIKSCIDNNIDIRNYPSLHAKIYIFDSRQAIITSANLTLGGLENNYECGILIDDSSTSTQLRSNFFQLFRDKDKVSSITPDIISTTQDILSKVPKEKTIHFDKSEKEIFAESKYEPEDDLYDGGVDTISETLSGWRLDIFKALLEIPVNIFELEQVYTHKQQLQKLHPDNRNIEAKIRQQLQELRDLGLVEFLGSGVYRKLWKDY
jgi:HKD family nuclease